MGIQYFTVTLSHRQAGHSCRLLCTSGGVCDVRVRAYEEDTESHLTGQQNLQK